MIQVLAFCTLIGIAWYALNARPQNDQQREHSELVGSLKVGDHVMTIGGVYGLVSEVSSDAVLLEVASGVTTRIAIAGIAQIVPGQPTHLAPPAPMEAVAAPEVAVTPAHPAPQFTAQPQAMPQYGVQQQTAPATPFQYRPIAAVQPAPMQHVQLPPVQRMHVQPVMQVGHQPVVAQVARVAGAAPKHSMLRLEPVDEALRARALAERAQLGEAYRNASSTLVRVSDPSEAQTGHTAAQPVVVPTTVPLFTSQRQAAAQSGGFATRQPTGQYPPPLEVPSAAQHAALQPALPSFAALPNAFSKPVPYRSPVQPPVSLNSSPESAWPRFDLGDTPQISRSTTA